ncbi:MAG: amidohydrolase family protein [Oscillospiraceae bacterium]
MALEHELTPAQDAALTEQLAGYTVCDAHTHIFPEKIALKAAESIGGFYGLPMSFTQGTSAELLRVGATADVKHYLVCSTATQAHQVESINRFIATECRAHPEFVGFGTLHPDYPDTEAEIERCIADGLRGIKIHPDFQEFYIDEERAYKIFKLCAGRLPVLVHMGDSRFDYSRPNRLENVMKALPDLTVFAAHLGGYERWEEASGCLYFDNIRFDTCSSLEFISKEYAHDIIKAFGTDKVFFGTDFPMWNIRKELHNFFALGFSQAENRRILAENFMDFFQL